MPSIREEMAVDIRNAIVLYGQSFEWMGRTIPCTRRDEPTMAELQEEGGFIEGANYFLVVSKLEFPDADFPNKTGFPVDGDLINEAEHQVKNVKGYKDPAAAQLVLAIGSVDR